MSHLAFSVVFAQLPGGNARGSASTGNRRCTRRAALAHGAAALTALSAPSLLWPHAARADAAQNAKEALEELAARTTGMGPGDVYFPDFFRGEWDVQRELYAIDLSKDAATAVSADYPLLGGNAVSALRNRVGVREGFHVRFVRHRGRVVADRAFNARAETAVERAGDKVTAMWSADNPNVVSLAAAGPKSSVTREIRVTKRAFVDSPNGYGSFVASEFQRVVDVEDDGALMGFGNPPSICAVRRITKYRVSSVTEGEDGELIPDGMDRFTVDYRYDAKKLDSPIVTVRYREFMTRL